jgi:uncharacterized membrane protein YhhN
MGGWHHLLNGVADIAAAAPGSPQGIPPPILEVHGRPHCIVDCGWGDPLEPVMKAAFWITILSTLTYGFLLSHLPPSFPRTILKTLPVAMLAVLAVFAAHIDAQFLPLGSLVWVYGLLTGGFVLCAVGDAFLAGDPKRWLPPGLAAFLLGHLCFIAMFVVGLIVGIDPLMIGPPSEPAPIFSPAAILGMVAVVVAGGAMLAWLWRDLGSMRWPVVAYVVVIVVMACCGLAEWSRRPAWAIGALLFMASDAILAVQLFKGRELVVSPRINGWAIWFLYYAAQVAFLMGVSQA